ncbi:MAG: polyamine aminopropyltransferase [Firmicutes bacterium]|nr:polyamine aminopropyltransferase [Bacillota bacterium]
MDLWYTEKQTENMGLSLKVNAVLHRETTPYQELAVLDTVQYGRMLVLDGMVQTTEKDEYVYHEMITHVAMYTHPNPRRVAVVGGGDGGAVREILKHSSVEKVVLAEIDEAVIEAARRYLPSISSALDDPRVDIMVGDGIAHIKARRGAYDVVIVDSTEPVGAAVGLFSREFYQAIYEALTEDGVLVAQTESPIVNASLIEQSFRHIRGIFPISRLYLACVPTYPTGLWSFSLGAKKYDPLQVDFQARQRVPAVYYNPDVHRAAFALPNFVRDLIEEPGEAAR